MEIYSIVKGIVHPKIGEKDSSTEFVDIGETREQCLVFENLLFEILKLNAPKNIDLIYNKFMHERVLTTNENNENIKKINEMFLLYKESFTGLKASGFKFYLIKKDAETLKVLDVIKYWKSFRDRKSV
tara:strand:- start:209 stop:592 length:384 start_codon:yes stop_codon:yes gene_type:complete